MQLQNNQYFSIDSRNQSQPEFGRNGGRSRAVEDSWDNGGFRSRDRAVEEVYNNRNREKVRYKTTQWNTRKKQEPALSSGRREQGEEQQRRYFRDSDDLQLFRYYEPIRGVRAAFAEKGQGRGNR